MLSQNLKISVHKIYEQLYEHYTKAAGNMYGYKQYNDGLAWNYKRR